MLKTHKIAMVTNSRQASLLAQHAGFARFAYNTALADFKAGLDAGEWLSDKALRPRFNAIKRELAPWSAQLSQNAGKYAIIDLGQAIDAFGAYRKAVKEGLRMRRVGFPSFRKRTAHFSFRADNGPGTVRMEGKAIRLPRVGIIRTREALRFAGIITEVTVIREAGRWFACITVKTGEQPEMRSISGAIGVDVGIRTLAVCSDGTTYENPRALGLYTSRLRRVDQAIARSKNAIGKNARSNRRDRRYRQRQRLHARIAAIRNDAHHKATSAIVAKSVGTVTVETLNVAGMFKNRRLAKSLSDSALAGFLAKLEYKCQWGGVRFEKAEIWYPSTKTCSECGAVRPNMDLSERAFVCHACGVIVDRDLNAAVNLAAYAESFPVKGRGADVSPGCLQDGLAAAVKRQRTASGDSHGLSAVGIGS